MLLAKESTEVAEQNQNGRPSEQFAAGKDLAVHGRQVEVKIDLHRTMMRWPANRDVILITKEHWPRGATSLVSVLPKRQLRVGNWRPAWTGVGRER